VSRLQSCAACAQANCALSVADAHAQFETLDAQVYGLSHDTPNAQLKWQTSKQLGYSLLCDPKQLLLKPLGASKGPGKLARSHFVVDKDGKLLHAKIGVKPADSCVGLTDGASLAGRCNAASSVFPQYRNTDSAPVRRTRSSSSSRCERPR